MSSGKEQKRAARAARLRAALRENVRRRKAQARGREQPGSRDEAPAPERPDGTKRSG